MPTLPSISVPRHKQRNSVGRSNLRQAVEVQVARTNKAPILYGWNGEPVTTPAGEYKPLRGTLFSGVTSLPVHNGPRPQTSENAQSLGVLSCHIYSDFKNADCNISKNEFNKHSKKERKVSNGSTSYPLSAPRNYALEQEKLRTCVAAGITVPQADYSGHTEYFIDVVKRSTATANSTVEPWHKPNNAERVDSAPTMILNQTHTELYAVPAIPLVAGSSFGTLDNTFTSALTATNTLKARLLPNPASTAPVRQNVSTTDISVDVVPKLLRNTRSGTNPLYPLEETAAMVQAPPTAPGYINHIERFGHAPYTEDIHRERERLLRLGKDRRERYAGSEYWVLSRRAAEDERCSRVFNARIDSLRRQREDYERRVASGW